jgi:polyhydroxybutyrate depolymerase
MTAIPSGGRNGSQGTGNTTEGPQKSLLAPGDFRFEILHDGITRYYLLHVPPSYTGGQTPLVLAFHGGLGTAETMADNYGWKPKSDKEGFLVAFPNGASRLPSGKLATWNAGNCCGYAAESRSDDVGFVKALIEDIRQKANVGNIYATGMSNGGMFSHRLGCEMPETFTAIAAVAGTNNFDGCNPQKPISVMHIHGLQDQHVLFYGGCWPECNVKSETDYVSVPDTINGWVMRDNCNKTPQRVLETENASCDLYTGCDGNVTVKLCVAKDGGHSWPGAGTVPNPFEKSNPSQAFSATDMIWDFFQSASN